MENKEFIQHLHDCFGTEADDLISRLNEKASRGFFLNTQKSDREELLKLLDFPYVPSPYSKDSFYHQEENIGKTLAYDLGVIYPQDIESALPAKYPDIRENMLVLDMCAAPGGKSINIYNRLSESCFLIANEVDFRRAGILSSNLERLGLDRCAITFKSGDELENLLRNACDLVILDAPCSGEGMLRKYPEIKDNYSFQRIEELADIQKKLLENAYQCLCEQGELLYSTCTYALEEDEKQISKFLETHPDMDLIPLGDLPSHSRLSGTVKLTPLDGCEGQFFALMRKKTGRQKRALKFKKNVSQRKVEKFLQENLKTKDFYLYRDEDKYYISLSPLYELEKNTLRNGIYLGSLVNDRFEPSHQFYRANSLRPYFNFSYELKDNECIAYLKGEEIVTDLADHYYLLTYQNLALGFGKAAKGRLKNKYPKGLRRML